MAAKPIVAVPSQLLAGGESLVLADVATLEGAIRLQRKEPCLSAVERFCKKYCQATSEKKLTMALETAYNYPLLWARARIFTRDQSVKDSDNTRKRNKYEKNKAIVKEEPLSEA